MTTALERQEGRAELNGWHTWYRVVGNLGAAIAAGRRPLVTLHGGPGASHDYLIRLERIQAPVLLISGRYDEATPATVQPYADRIPDVRWTIFEESSHLPHLEEGEACLKLVAEFLAANERRGE